MAVKKFRRGLVSVPLFITLVSSSVIAYSQPARSAGMITLNIAGCWTDSGQGGSFQRVVNMYNKVQNKVHVVPTYNNGVAKILTQELGGSPPDVYFDCSTAEVGSWAKNGYILPLQPYIDKSHFDVGTITDSARRYITYQGQSWAMPFLEDTFMLLYNRTLFKQGGLDPSKPPATFEQMRTYADKLTKVDSSGKITQLGMLPTWAGSDFVGTWLPVYITAFGGKLIDSSGKQVTANCPQCVQALQWERSYYDKWGASRIDRFSSQFASLASAAGNAFFSGKTAMVIEGEWNPKFAAEYAPKVDWAVAPLPYPAGHPELLGSGMAGGNPGMIMKGSKHPDEAWNFLRWIETLPPTMAFANAINNVPQLKAALSSPQLDSNPKYRQFVHYAFGPKVVVFPVTPVSSEFANELTQIEDLVVHGKMTPKAGLDKVTKDIQAKLGGNSVP